MKYPAAKSGFSVSSSSMLSRSSAVAWSMAAGVMVIIGLVALTTWRSQPLAVAAGIVAAAAAVMAMARKRQHGLVADMLLAAAEDSHAAHLISDVDGVFVYANPAFYRLFAMAVSVDAISKIIDGGVGASDFSRLIAKAKAGIPASAEIPLRVPPGIVEWRRISIQPVPGKRGHLLWRAEDITADREMSAVRYKEKKMMADFFDYLPIGFFSVDAEGLLINANRTLGDWLGISIDNLNSQGMRFSDFVVAGENTAPSDDTVSDAVDYGEVTLRAVNGRTFGATLVQSEKVDDDGEMIYSRSLLLRNMPKRGSEGLSQSLVHRLHWLFDEAPVGIVLLDISGNVTDCNRAFLKLLGLHHNAVKGLPLTDFIGKEDCSDVGGQLSKVVMGTIKAAHLDVRMRGLGQQELAASTYASRIEDKHGEVSGLILHFIDNTEQKHLEVQFAQSQKMQAVGQLAGGVAHDFNNLLTAMIGFCDLLLERHDLADPSFADIMQIKQNANRATNLVRQLLAFSRKQTLQPETLDPNEQISELSNLLGRLIGENIELKIETGRHIGQVFVDGGQFDQVIINLAVNARDAMPGGGTVTIRTDMVSFDEPVQRGHDIMDAGSYVLVEVMDTGQGISRENIDHIFEPFFSTKDVGAGTGLGLSTVYGIIHQTGGFISVDSAIGDGATFSIYLPAYDYVDPAGDAQAADSQDKTVSPSKQPSEEDLTGSGSILLVEDEDAVRMFAGRALRNKGYRVLEANNGEAALDVINGSDEKINLIISDLVMPGMDGHTLIQLVRHEFPDVRVILMSGYSENVFAEEIEHDPSIHFMAKPFSLKDLAGKVKEVIYHD